MNRSVLYLPAAYEFEKIRRADFLGTTDKSCVLDKEGTIKNYEK
jgi:hypothetical protein